jgi:hypothetical protein
VVVYSGIFDAGHWLKDQDETEKLRKSKVQLLSVTAHLTRSRLLSGALLDIQHY